MLCTFCSNLIPITRKNTFGGRPQKYCSDLCNKRSWYMRNFKPKESLFNDNPQKGIAWEEWFIKKFGAKRPQRSLNTPYDFIWNEEKIDLKVCELYKRKMKRGKLVKKTQGWWVFNRNGSEADFIICIGLIGNKISRVFKIPEKNFPISGATISPTSTKYEKYAFSLA